MTDRGHPIMRRRTVPTSKVFGIVKAALNNLNLASIQFRVSKKRMLELSDDFQPARVGGAHKAVSCTQHVLTPPCSLHLNLITFLLACQRIFTFRATL